jgi:hypothetical protein
MSAALHMASDQVQVDPGSTVALSLDVSMPVNGETSAESGGHDRFELTVEGLDPAWIAIPEPTFDLRTGETTTQRVFFKPPRESESVSGSYPFVVQVRSLNSGESRSQQGVLVIKPFHHLTADLTPRRAQVTGLGTDEPNFRVAISNLGNVDEVLHVSAGDNEGALACEFSDEQVMISPGQTIALPMTVRPKRKATLAATRLHTFTFTARSVNQPAVGASAQGHLEQKALISPGIFASILVILALLAGFFLMMPKPPKVVTAQANPTTVTVGESVTISWRADGAEKVELIVGETLVSQSLDPSSSYLWSAKEPGEYQIQVVPVRGDWKGQAWTETLTVSELAPTPAPQIVTFDIQPRRVKVGESYQVTYRVNDAVTKLTLSPIGRDLDPRTDGVRLVADLPGQFEYKLTAMNQAGDTVSETIRLEFYEASNANIVAFRTNAKEVDPGTEITLEWTVTGAARIELSNGAETQTLNAATGSATFVIDKDTTFRLTAYDDRGLKSTQEVTVKLKVETPPDNVPPINDPPTDPPTTTGGTGTGGGTGGRTTAGTGGRGNDGQR